jgi:ectoine hydroxylase-related dioxygenase (phytanoyl-CoA dioxygenase family)
MYINIDCLLDDPLTATFKNEGYSHIPNVLSAAEAASLLEAVEAARSVAVARKRGAGIFALRHLLKEVDAVSEIANSPKLMDIIRPILGNGAFPVRGVFLDNNPDNDWYTHWHQDLTIAVKKRIEVSNFGPWSVRSGTLHVQPPTEVLMRMVALRLHLDESPVDDGALRVLPGTHLQGVITGRNLTHWTNHGKEVVLPSQAGDVLLIRPLLLHSSVPCKAAGSRRIVHIEYAAESLPDGLEWAIA